MFRITYTIILVLSMLFTSCNNTESNPPKANAEHDEVIKIPMFKVSCISTVAYYEFAGDGIKNAFEAIQRCKHLINPSTGSAPSDLWVIRTSYVSKEGIEHIKTTYILADEGPILIEGSDEDIALIKKWFDGSLKEGKFGEIEKQEGVKNFEGF